MRKKKSLFCFAVSLVMIIIEIILYFASDYKFQEIQDKDLEKYAERTNRIIEAYQGIPFEWSSYSVKQGIESVNIYVGDSNVFEIVFREKSYVTTITCKAAVVDGKLHIDEESLGVTTNGSGIVIAMNLILFISFGILSWGIISYLLGNKNNFKNK